MLACQYVTVILCVRVCVYVCVRERDLQHAALADPKGVSQQVKVGTSDFHVFDATNIRPGHHLAPGRGSDV